MAIEVHTHIMMMKFPRMSHRILMKADLLFPIYILLPICSKPHFTTGLNVLGLMPLPHGNWKIRDVLHNHLKMSDWLQHF